MSLKRIKRRLSQTFTRFHDGSLTELAEHLTIDENGGIRENGASTTTPTFTRISRRLSLSNSRIFADIHKQGKFIFSCSMFFSYGMYQIWSLLTLTYPQTKYNK